MIHIGNESWDTSLTLKVTWGFGLNYLLPCHADHSFKAGNEQFVFMGGNEQLVVANISEFSVRPSS